MVSCIISVDWCFDIFYSNIKSVNLMFNEKNVFVLLGVD